MQITRSQFQKTILPLLLIVVALVVLNLGLYTLLTANPVPIERLPLPYTDAFTAENQSARYMSFGGDWDVRDEQLVQINTVGLDLGTLIPVEAAPDQPYRYEVDVRHLGNGWGGGLIFNAQHLNSRQQSHMVRFNEDGGNTYVIYGVFGNDSDFTGQGSVPAALTLEDSTRLGVEVGVETYDVLLNGEAVALDIPLTYMGGAVGLITSGSQVAFDNVAVTTDGIAPVVVENTPNNDAVEVVPDETVFTGNDEMLFADDFDATGTGSSAWTPFAGEWAFTDGVLRQLTFDGFDFAAGNVNQVPPEYTYRVTFQHLEGQGGGLLFNMLESDERSSAHMVRYVHDADFLTWGYFDEETQYTGQGSAPVPAPGNTPHVLSVIVGTDSYQILLDGEPLTGAVPVMAEGNHIGLVTAQSVVDFIGVEVLTGDETFIATEDVSSEAIAAGVEAVGASGEWVTTETGTVQVATEQTDYIAGTGFAAETFALDVVITHDPGSGGGVVFHMAERDNPALGTMVRFDETDDVLFWGQYDAEGVFTGQGSTPVAVADEPLALRLVIRPGTFDIVLDGEVLVGDIPLARGEGWIGLVSYSGEVAFDALALSRDTGEVTP